jgi:hypothetical protein
MRLIFVLRSGKALHQMSAQKGACEKNLQKTGRFHSSISLAALRGVVRCSG